MAVIGAGWSGLAASVHACLRGHRVSLLEMAREPGGRARSVSRGELSFDNGQHILIGAYTRTLALMRTVGVDPDRVLLRLPLSVTLPDGSGLRLPSGHPAVAFAFGVLRHRRWPLGARVALLCSALRWRRSGFRCDPGLTVAELTAGLPPCVRDELIDPLSVAALNTPSQQASAAVLLRVLRDGLFGGRGSADLLLPHRPLAELLPDPALRWLVDRGAQVCMGRRVQRIEREGSRWRVDGQPHDDVIVATSAVEAARLVGPIDPRWAELTAALRHEPIVTVMLAASGTRLPAPMVAMPRGPAQFAFDHGAIGGPPGRFAFVISGAARWLDRGREALQAAVLDQAATQFPPGTWVTPPEVIATTIERRATFACTPSLVRPRARIDAGLVAAGDYVAGPYPATLEGAVMAGIEAAGHCGR